MSVQQIAAEFREELRRAHLNKLFLTKRLLLMNGSRTVSSTQEMSTDKKPDSLIEDVLEMSVSTLSDDEEYDTLQLLKDELDECASGSRIIELTSVVQKIRVHLERIMAGGTIDQEYPSAEAKAAQEATRIQRICRKFVAVGLLKDILQFASHDPKVYQRLRHEALGMLAVVSNGDRSVCRAFLEGGFFNRARILLAETVVSAAEVEAVLSTMINLMAEEPNFVVDLISSKCLALLEEHFMSVAQKLTHLGTLSGDQLVRAYHESREIFNIQNMFCMIWLLSNCLRASDRLPRVADSSNLISQVYHLRVLIRGLKEIEAVMRMPSREQIESGLAQDIELENHWKWSLYHYLDQESHSKHRLGQKIQHLRSFLNLGNLGDYLDFCPRASNEDPVSHKSCTATKESTSALLSVANLILEHGLSEEYRDLSLVEELLGTDRDRSSGLLEKCLSYLDDVDRSTRLIALKFFGLLTMEFSSSVLRWSTRKDRIFEVNEEERLREFRLRRLISEISSQSSVKGISNILLLDNSTEVERRCLFILSDLWIVHSHLNNSGETALYLEEYQPLWKSTIDVVLHKMAEWLQTTDWNRFDLHNSTSNSQLHSESLAGALEFLNLLVDGSCNLNSSSWTSRYLSDSTQSIKCSLDFLSYSSPNDEIRSLCRDLISKLKH